MTAGHVSVKADTRQPGVGSKQTRWNRSSGVCGISVGRHVAIHPRRCGTAF